MADHTTAVRVRHDSPARWVSVLAFALSCLGLGTSLASLVDYLGADPDVLRRLGLRDRPRVGVGVSARDPDAGVRRRVLRRDGRLAVGRATAPAARDRARRCRVGARPGRRAGVRIQAWCKLCMVADSSATALALCVPGRRTVDAADGLARCWERDRRRVAARVRDRDGAIGRAGRDRTAQSARGRARRRHACTATWSVTIVEFVDFECPFCRRLAPELAAAVDHATTNVAVIRKMVPLGMHPHARTAALAWCCADAQGKGDAMAKALFDAPPDELTPEGCERIAAQVGCDLDRYREALADPATMRASTATRPTRKLRVRMRCRPCSSAPAVHRRKLQRRRFACRDRSATRTATAMPLACPANGSRTGPASRRLASEFHRSLRRARRAGEPVRRLTPHMDMSKLRSLVALTLSACAPDLVLRGSASRPNRSCLRLARRRSRCRSPVSSRRDCSATAGRSGSCVTYDGTTSVVSAVARHVRSGATLFAAEAALVRWIPRTRRMLAEDVAYDEAGHVPRVRERSRSATTTARASSSQHLTNATSTRSRSSSNAIGSRVGARLPAAPVAGESRWGNGISRRTSARELSPAGRRASPSRRRDRRRARSAGRQLRGRHRFARAIDRRHATRLCRQPRCAACDASSPRALGVAPVPVSAHAVHAESGTLLVRREPDGLAVIATSLAARAATSAICDRSRPAAGTCGSARRDRRRARR